MHVLIAGAAGYIGRNLVPALEKEHTLRLGDVYPLGDPRFVPLDVTQPDQVRAVMRGVDAVVHLAIASGHEGDFEDDAFNQVRFDVNVKGTFNVLDAARRAGVRRVVSTSSLMVVWGYPPPERVSADAAGRPVGSYAYTKFLGEQLCERFARDHGMSIVSLRISKPIDLADPVWKNRPLRPQWIPLADLCRAYSLALTAGIPAGTHEIITVTARHHRCRWDLSKAERLLGWRPEVDLESLGYVIGGESTPLVS